MNKEVDTYKIFRQLEERSKRANPYTFYDKDELIDEILKLEDNWNELEEWVRNLIDDNNNRYELYKDDKLHYEYEISNIKYQNNMLVEFLDKMKEIKECNNENK